MTDRENLLHFLDTAGVGYVTGPAHATNERGAVTEVIVPSAAYEGMAKNYGKEGAEEHHVGSTLNEGHMMFFSAWEFDADGRLVAAGAWE